MATERQAPDTIAAQTDLTGAVTDIDDDPNSPDGLWLVASGNNVSTDVRVTFPTPTGDPRVGANLQDFTVYVRQFDTGQSGTPTCHVELWENGVLVRAGSNFSVTGSGQTNTFTWDAAELATADGSLVECKVVGNKTGGSPSTRNTVDVGAVEWNVDYSVSPVINPGPAFGVGGNAAPMVIQGSVSITPAVTMGVQAAVDPTPVLGSLSITPAVAAAVQAAVDSTVDEGGGDITVTPTAASGLAASVAPTVELGALTVSPSPVSAVQAGLGPTVELGAISITSTPASALAAVLGPTIELGSLSIIPGPAAGPGAVVDPVVVLGSMVVVPLAIDVVGGRANPTVVIGVPGLEISPSPAFAVGEAPALWLLFETIDLTLASRSLMLTLAARDATVTLTLPARDVALTLPTRGG